MAEQWIKTSDLLKQIAISRMSLDRMRRGESPLLHPGVHFIRKSDSVNAGFLWNPEAVVRTLAAQAIEPAATSMPFLSTSSRQPDFTRGLSPEQTTAFNAITQLIASAKSRCGPGDDQVLSALLRGYAGTGKSFLVARIQKWCEHYFSNPRQAINSLAPTHKAANELKHKLHDSGNDFVEVCTLTQFLGKKKGYDGKGNMVFKVGPDGLPPTPPTLRVVFLDELSMVPDEDMQLLIKRLSKHAIDTDYPRKFPQIVVVGIGDPRQLAPVKAENTIFEPGEEHSSWHAESWDVDVELKSVYRHSGAILALATEVRTQGTTGRPEMFTDHTGKTSVDVMPSSEWIEMWLACLQDQKKWPENPACETQALAYTNKTVSKLNAIARDELYGEGAAPFQSGERIISIDAILDPLEDAILCGSATEIVVVESTREPHNIDGVVLNGYMISGFMPHIKDKFGGQAGIFFRTLDPSDRPVLKELIGRRKALAIAQENIKKKATEKEPFTRKQELNRKELWRNYYELNEIYSHVDPAYCLTVHKSQGSTYHRVFVDQLDIDSCRDKKQLNQLTYVAVSRASNELFIRLN